MLCLGVLVIAAMGVAWWAPWKPTLVVWSCGSNYESIADFSRGFEEGHNCRVRYTGAPVQYLLELALQRTGEVDVIVGRAGPGWEKLRQEDKLAYGPVYFVVDPYVIITQQGNPKGIAGLEDLGKPGIRVAHSPYAMRPRGMCPAHLMAAASEQFHPGLVERWENNAVDVLKCGRMLHEPVVAGEADAAVVPLNVTAWPELRGRVEVIPIDTKYLLAMKQCRATMPQCAGVVARARQSELARAFVDELAAPSGRALLERHGYVHISAPQAKAFEPLLEVFVPQNMAAWQVHLGRRLDADEVHREAIRRFFCVINLFGPSQ